MARVKGVGVVPSSFRICRELLDRIEDSFDGRMLLPELNVAIPTDRRHQAAATAVDFPIGGHFPFVEGAEPMVSDPTEQLLARTWHPSLSVTGVDGIPPVESAGNVLRPHTSLHLSVRLPPTCDHDLDNDGHCDPVATCGNGAVEAGEACDDGNVIAHDGCSATCQIELSVCGNGIHETGEECDDGNLVSGDGCSAACVCDCPSGH